eukprot:1291383-Pyramimonas_sp.AAC.1
MTSHPREPFADLKGPGPRPAGSRTPPLSFLITDGGEIIVDIAVGQGRIGPASLQNVGVRLA